jgi:hypothetical protein
MKTLYGLTSVLLIALLVALAQCSCCGTGPATPTSPTTKITTKTFGGGDVTFKGDEEQLNKIADVELIPEGDSRYPQSQDISGDVTEIIRVFEIKLKSGVKSVAPPTITIKDIHVGQKGVQLKNQGLANRALPIHRFDPSTNNWPVAGEAKLKADPEWADGEIWSASLLAIVSTARVAAPTQPPLQDLEARVYESTKQIIANEDPGRVSIIWGSEAAPYGEVAELTAANFAEQGIETRSEFIPDAAIVQERVIAEREAGTLADCVVLIGVSGDIDSLRGTMTELETGLYVYNDESGYLEKQAP